ncbi:zinc ribbon domain-containing protein [candidate division KSB1 bacterium]|nr:zinc ribbon domain-containing protein [candidate division KSB1 bacterium]MBL7094444.1 zinc ribbon domain-containing protein [candidate division KSB1 bacterium]
MPVYEFFCGDCNTIYQFFSRTINTTKIPSCPHCKNAQLNRVASMFAAISGSSDKDSTGKDFPQIDEAKMEKAMVSLAKEADRIDEDNPRQAANLMRKLTKETGLKLGSGMEEALSRMEKGEDPDKIEKEMGDLLESEEPFLFEDQKTKSHSKPRINREKKIYDL